MHNKGFATFITLVWFLSSMTFLMVSQAWTLDKSFTTFITFVWFLSTMNSLMFYKFGTMEKSLVTFITLVRFLSSMDYLMVREAWAHTKGSATLITFVRFFPVCFMVFLSVIVQQPVVILVLSQEGVISHLSTLPSCWPICVCPLRVKSLFPQVPWASPN